jgi:hypothetical protein
MALVPNHTSAKPAQNKNLFAVAFLLLGLHIYAVGVMPGHRSSISVISTPYMTE